MFQVCMKQDFALAKSCLHFTAVTIVNGLYLGLRWQVFFFFPSEFELVHFLFRCHYPENKDNMILKCLIQQRLWGRRHACQWNELTVSKWQPQSSLMYQTEEITFLWFYIVKRKMQEAVTQTWTITFLRRGFLVFLVYNGVTFLKFLITLLLYQPSLKCT